MIRKDFFYEQSTEQENSLTGTLLPSITIFLREDYSMTSTGSDFTLDSNDKTTQQILDKHTTKFSKAWETLAKK